MVFYDWIDLNSLLIYENYGMGIRNAVRITLYIVHLHCSSRVNEVYAIIPLYPSFYIWPVLAGSSVIIIIIYFIIIIIIIIITIIIVIIITIYVHLDEIKLIKR